ncbi:3,5-dihydroxyphenylacetyl-CoA monooxygenase [Terracoccus luteus]|uniref:3,5-dihydroxyphenylacetyl-CoA monooxygenase n=1 Tax=Terracoccus luteus TaxID=53356 RepID=A0A495XYY9_9MICO|nr:enoyl-CoA hydratase/isomerase family protein [Terracoccus luteus]RKT79517.1 3,5-dihydroxyphenylacetyl-CoA monooxygenase [Terracoccus luteus]
MNSHARPVDAGSVERVAGLRSAHGASPGTGRAELDVALHDALEAGAVDLYRTATDDGRVRLRMVELGDRVAELVPGLLPTRDQRAEDAARPLEEQRGWEVDHAILLHHVLSDQSSGLHLLDSMRRPTPAAERDLAAYTASGRARSGTVTLERRGAVSLVQMEDGLHLNAEDLDQLRSLEYLADLCLLDPLTSVVLLRGGVMSHPKYRGRRVFCAGINLRELAAGRIPLVGYLLEREAGYLAKILHGLSTGGRGSVRSKPWVAGVDGFAIGGGTQLLLVCDRVVAAEGVFASLPAAQEGIIPGAANMRLIRQVGARMTRELVLTGRAVRTDDDDAHLVFDRVVSTEEMDAALDEECLAMAEPAVRANRHMVNASLESPDDLRRYLADFALLQAQRARSDDVLGKASAFGRGDTPDHDRTDDRTDAQTRGQVHVHRADDGTVTAASGHTTPPFPPAPVPPEGAPRWPSRPDL